MMRRYKGAEMVYKKKLATLMFVVFLFCAIFTPDFFPFSMRYLVIIICAIGIGWKWIRTRKAILDKRFLSIFIGFIPFIIWLVVSQILHMVWDGANSSIYLNTLLHTLEVFLAGFLIGLFLIYVCEDNRFDLNDILSMIIAVTLLQFVCVILALLFPGVREFFNSFIIKNSYSERLAQLALASSSGRIDRSYGLSNNLFDSFGFITAVLICIMFIVGMEKNNNKIRLASMLMILMPLVNARTGLFLALVGMVVSSFFYLDYRTIAKNMGIVIIGIAAFLLIMSRLPNSMISWLTSGFQETQALFSRSENIGVYSKIFGSDLVFPSSILLGGGGMPKNLISYGVDNGYINCLWNFGLIGTLLLLAGYFRMFKLSYSRTRVKMNKVISVVTGIIFFLYLFKVYSIDNFGGIVLVYGIISVILTRGNVENRAKYKIVSRKEKR